MARASSLRIYWAYGLFPVAVAVGLAVWAHAFVVEAVAHNPILNLSILLIIVGGVAITLAALVAFQREAGQADRVLRLARAEGRDAAVASVRALPAGSRTGTAFRAALDESGPLSSAERESEVRRLQDSLQAELRLPGFLSGFMIALGLFGTFIGLLETLQSTGALIASFGAQTTDTPAAVGRLVKGMQGPLAGMATSFSASLFGLLGSLVLSAMLTALQALAHRIVVEVRGGIVLIGGDPAPAAGGDGVVRMARGIERLMQQQQQAMDLFLRSREADEAAAQSLQRVALAIEAHQTRVDRVIDGQAALHRAMEVQQAQSERLAAALITQTEAVTTIKRSQELLVRVTEQVAGATAHIGRIAGELEVTQRRVLATERRSSELFAALATGVDTLAERDASLADMQRAAIDSVRHAAQIGQRLGEASAHFADIRATVTDAISTGLVRLEDIQASQAAQQAEMVRGLHHLLTTLEFKDRDVVSLLRNQSADLSGMRDDLAAIAGRLGEAPTTEDTLERLSHVLAGQLGAAQDALIGRLSRDAGA